VLVPCPGKGGGLVVVQMPPPLKMMNEIQWQVKKSEWKNTKI